MSAAMSLGEKLYRAVYPGDMWDLTTDATRTMCEKAALIFVASLTHDETTSAVIAVQAFDIANLRSEVGEWKTNANEAEEVIAAQAEEITALRAKYQTDMQASIKAIGEAAYACGSAEARHAAQAEEIERLKYDAEDQARLANFAAHCAAETIAAQGLRIASLSEALNPDALDAVAGRLARSGWVFAASCIASLNIIIEKQRALLATSETQP